jgi:transposase
MMRPQQQQRPDVLEERAAFAEAMKRLDAARLIFVDESGLVRGMRLSYGYAQRGERCVENAPFRVGKRRSLIGWMAATGGGIVHFEGTVTADVFEQFVREHLVPHLNRGDVVIWDNARIHRREAVRLVEAAGACVVPLPRYSPEYNAIEHLWSKLKHGVRKLRADTAEALREALAAAVAWLRPADGRAWIEHCGYRFLPD